MPGCEETQQIFCEWKGEVIILVIKCNDSLDHEGMHQGNLPVLIPAESGKENEKKTKLGIFFWE